MAVLGEGVSKFRPPLEWAVKPAQLEAMDLPRPRLEAGSRLVMDVGPHDFAVSVHALPPSEGRLTRFWERMQQLRGRGEVLHPEQLQIAPPVLFEEFTPGEHAPLSAMYPVVLMENGTRFGVEVSVPTALVDSWSDEKRRSHPDLGIYFDEIYKVRTSVGAVVRINGEPLGELRTEGLKLRQVRQETFTGFSQDGDETEYRGRKYDGGLLAKRTRAVMTDPGQTEYQTEQTNLVFYVTGEQGTSSNADFDTKNGIVQVVFIAYDTGDEQVIGIDDSEHAKHMRRLDSLGGGSRGSYSPLSFGGPLKSGTLQGEVRYEKSKIVKSKIGGVSNIRPLTEANLVLVGEGGPLPGQMTEAPQPQQA